MRGVLRHIAVLGLLLQAGTAVSAHTALWSGMTADWRECQCVHGDHAICPMHHSPSRDKDHKERCVWRSSGDHSDSVLASLVAVFGFRPEAAPTLLPGPSRLTAPLAPASPLVRLTPPDSPPPRLS